MDVLEKKLQVLSPQPDLSRYARFAEKLFANTGVQFNGDRDFDIQVNNNEFYRRLIVDGSLGLGESYMDGWWDCKNLPECASRLYKAKLIKKIRGNFRFILNYLILKLTNLQSKSRAYQVAENHYDLGNDLFKVMLDKSMIYSCGYWNNAQTLDEAQEAKLDLICQKLQLRAGMRLLDIGCGWGGLAKFAAENYGVSVVGITVSVEQFQLAKEICAGLPIEIRLQDYRDLNESFDRIASIAMFEAVGQKNFRSFMQIVHRCLEDDGLFLLHTIGANKPIVARVHDPWVDKYIFPNGEVPSIKQIGESSESLFVMEDWHNFGAYYEKTLRAWYENFKEGWDDLKNRYDQRFFRMWEYYLLVAIGLFQARILQLWQVVFSKKGIPGGYQKYISYHFD
jgi:cyclopropane-fatty-acyl-phospholipid synthase